MRLSIIAMIGLYEILFRYVRMKVGENSEKVKRLEPFKWQMRIQMLISLVIIISTIRNLIYSV